MENTNEMRYLKIRLVCCVYLADQRLTHGSRFAFQGLDDGQDEVNVRHRFRLHVTPLDV